MNQPSLDQLTPLQQTILDVVRKYPDQFSRSGLAKMLVGAKSWQDRSCSEYGRFSKYRGKDLDYQIEILRQQQVMLLDVHDRLMPAPSSVRQE